MFRPLASLLPTLFLTACTWVQLTAEGQAVSVAEPSQVSQCTRVGRTTARTLNEVVTVDRSAEKLQEELLILARNDAGDMGGNTIVPETVIREGSQVFAVYTCP